MIYKVERKNNRGEWIVCFTSSREEDAFEEFRFYTSNGLPGIVYRVTQTVTTTIYTNE